MITKKISTLLNQQTVRVKSVDFHPVKPIFIIGLHDGRIQAWDYNSNACIYEFIDTKTVEHGSIRSIKFHPHGDFFVSSGDDKIIRMWDYTKRKLLKTFKGHTDFIRSVDFHPTKPWIISSSDDQTIKVWNFMTGKCLATATGHSHYVMCAKFLDESLIISGSLDNTIQIWDCKNLLEKTNKFVPDIIVRQIVQGHERGVNFIEIYYENNEILLLSGGDDREIKLWDYRVELYEKETIFAHQGCVSKAILNNNTVCSVGEDGLFCIFDLKTKKYSKYHIEGRFWNLACKNDIFICGHDNGFDILEFSEPKLLTFNEKGIFYLKNVFFYFSDLNVEKKICKAEGDVLSLNYIEYFLLITYSKKFEVYEKNKKILQKEGKAVFLLDEEFLLVEQVNNKILITKDKKIVNSFTENGKLLFGDKKYFFIEKNNFIFRYSKDGLVDSCNLGFPCDKIFVSATNEFYAFLSKNKIALYDKNFNLINQENEIVNIKSGFFYENIFIYSTTKHLKYLFEEQGVLISLDNIMFPFYYNNNLIYYISEDGIESVEVDITEIIFKREVITNRSIEKITKIIESGSLPGISPLSFLIKNKKGDIALLYIKNSKQRFELCLSTGKLEECLKYCEEEKNIQMYEKLSVVALEKENFEISEKCLMFLNEWYELFFLYVCTKKIEKLENLLEICDEQTEKIIKLFLEDTRYFYNNYIENINESINKLEINKKDDKQDKKDENNSDDSENISDDSDISSENFKDNKKRNTVDNSNVTFSKELLEKINFELVEIDTSYKTGYECVTKGNFIEAIDNFRNCLYTIAKTSDSKKDLRIKLGEYLSGLKIQLLRKKEEDPKKQISYAKYFANLDLSSEHKKLAVQEFISVCIKNGNFKDAKEQAMLLKDENSKIVRKALKLEGNENKIIITEGIFCFDTKEYEKTAKECLFCFVKNKSGDICSMCEIGYLSN